MFVFVSSHKPIIFDNAYFYTVNSSLISNIRPSCPTRLYHSRHIRRSILTYYSKSRPLLHYLTASSLQTYQLVIATTHNLLIYGLPSPDIPDSPTEKKGKNKKKSKSKSKSVPDPELQLLRTVEVPQLPVEGGTFRAAKYEFPLPTM